MSELVVGVDGGGTKVRAVVLDGEGREIGRAEGAGAVASAHAPEEAAAAVASVVRASVAGSGGALPVRALWAGLSGAGRDDAREAVTAALASEGLAEAVTVGTDVEAAFADAFGAGPGVLLIAGTGSIALARGADGGMVRVGGWGAHLGDEGSGFWIGTEALRAVAAAADGRTEPTAMAGLILEAAGVADVDALIGWVATATKAQVAALARVAFAAAEDGDIGAAAIVAAAGETLEHHLEVILGRAGLEGEGAVAFAGALLAADGPLRGRLEEAAARIGLRVIEGVPDAALGAAALARGDAG